jgi:SRSO17 transposase
MAIRKAGAEPLEGLAAFLGPFGALVRRSESKHALERYTTGLLSDLTSKTAAQMGRSLPGTNDQRLQEFLTNTAWEAGEMDRLRIAHMLDHASVGDGVLVVDDTGIAKKGTHSVGTARQYSGTLGRVDNCQVLVTAHYVDGVFDWPVKARLYLPDSWTKKPERCRKGQVPQTIGFQTKGEIALGLIDEGRNAGIEPKAVLSDAGYGDQPAFLDGLEARQLPYGVAVGVAVRFRLAEQVEADPGDPPSPAYTGKGRPRKVSTLADRIQSLEAKAILDGLPAEAWREVSWREGTKGALVKQCARVRVYRSGQRSKHITSSGWLIGERPLEGHAGDQKQYFVWGFDKSGPEEVLGLLHVRWVIERFYQDAKGELGFDQYEGRLWPGLHRHLALVMLAHCFLTLQQSYGAAVVARNPAPPARGFPPGGTKKYRRAPAACT